MLRFVFAVFLMVVPARAELPAGHDEPAFQVAVEAWLDGDDEAMKTIYKLAGQGNVAALIAHSRFRKRSSRLSHPRLDYLWLDFAAKSPLGLAFRISWHDLPARTAAETVGDFIELGEHREAAEQMRREAVQARSDEREFSVPNEMVEEVFGPQLDPLDRFYTLFVVWDEIPDSTLLDVIVALCDEANRSPSTLGAILRYCEAVSEGDQQTEIAIRSALLLHQPKEDPFDRGTKIVRDWLSMNKDMPHRRLCSLICTDRFGDCAVAVWRQTAQAVGFVSIGSPVETLVSQERYIASRRADLELWHKLSLARAWSLEHRLDTGWGEAPACVLGALGNGNNPWRPDSE